MGEGFSRTVACSIGRGASSAGDSTEGASAGGTKRAGAVDVSATLASLATGDGLTDMYTIPDATTAPATNADTIFPSIFEPSTIKRDRSYFRFSTQAVKIV